jgi:hypothetical protein
VVEKRKILSKVVQVFVGSDLLLEFETVAQLTDFFYYRNETGTEKPV